jgi:hypothetical protein
VKEHFRQKAPFDSLSLLFYLSFFPRERQDKLLFATDSFACEKIVEVGRKRQTDTGAERQRAGGESNSPVIV